MSVATIKTQIPAELKAEAEKTLRELGLDLTTGIRMFLAQVVRQGGIPFPVKLYTQPNAKTLKAIEDSYAGRVEPFDIEEMFAQLEKKR
jgi:DNA-damage-inducible protein J